MCSVNHQPPAFELTYEPTPGCDDVTCKPLELVDFEALTYALTYSRQNFGQKPVQVTLSRVGGQQPIHK